MKTFLTCLQSDLNRAFYSLRFLAAVVLVAIVCCINSFVTIVNGSSSVCYDFSYAQLNEFTQILILPICALPGATLFCADWDNRYFRPLAFRTGLRPYGISKVLACAISAIGTDFVGKLIFFLFIAARFRIFMQAGYKGEIQLCGEFGAFASLLKQQQYFLYFFFCELVIALTCAFFAVIALWISAVLSNMFVVIASPIIVSFLVDKISFNFGLPRWLNPIALQSGYSMGGVWQSLLYSFVFFGVMLVLFGWLFMRKARWRIQNG